MKSSDNVAYCDNHILIALKPAGWLTQPDGTSTPDLESALKEWVKQTYHKPGAVFLHAVHRLDKPVSGLVLFARTSKALSRLNEEVRAGRIRRIYTAEVEGLLSQEEGCLEHFIEHGEHRAILSSPQRGQRARLHYWVEKRMADRTRIRIELETGRYHQIRIQCAAIGHPVVGDVRYGAKGREAEGIGLHCQELFFQHPVTKEELHFKSAI